MDTEKIMRTSVFGGFKKEDVISYVEELKKEIESLKADVEKKDGKIGELNSKVLEAGKAKEAFEYQSEKGPECFKILFDWRNC